MEEIQELYKEVIKKAQENVTILNEKLSSLEELKEQILKNNTELNKEVIKAKEEAVKIPEIFNEKFDEIIEFSKSYTESLGASATIYLEGNNSLFIGNLAELKFLLNHFNSEIERLKKTDYRQLFSDLQKEFMIKTSAGLDTEFEKLDDKSNDLQGKIDSLNNEVERIKLVDIEKHFNKLQKVLSEVFNAIASINLTLTTITQSLTGVSQILNSIQDRIDSNNKEIKKSHEKIGGLAEIVTKEFNSFDEKLNELLEENATLKKEISKNRIIQLIGIGIIGVMILYVIIDSKM